MLGLLTTSVKTGFESAYQARGLYAGRLAQFDRCLRDYGPETAPIRTKLHGYVAAVIASTWPEEPRPKGVAYPDTSHMPRTGEDASLADVMDQVGLDTRALTPSDPLHRSIAAACVADYADVQRSRWAVIEGLHGAISTPFYWVLVYWLSIMFGCFGLRAPADPAQHHRHRDVRDLGQRGDLHHPRSRLPLRRPVRRAEQLHEKRAQRHVAVSGDLYQNA